MKLILTIVRDSDSDQVTHALVAAGFRVTHIASTGGFFRKGSTTLMIGVSDDKVEEALNTIRDHLSATSEKGVRRATLFVLPVENFTQV